MIPAADQATRQAIVDLSEGFAWVEVMRDRNVPVVRGERVAAEHHTLAAARNALLRLANQSRPRHYISWDTDLLVPEGTVDRLRGLDVAVVTPWTWLNRQEPSLLRHFDGKAYHEVLWQPPVCATAMAWHPRAEGSSRAAHYPSEQFEQRARGTWRCDVALAFKLMTARAYGIASYSPHCDGENVPFAWRLRQRGVPVHCHGAIQGVHLYDRGLTGETSMRWPHVMSLAAQRPLATTWTEERSLEYEAVGFYRVG